MRARARSARDFDERVVGELLRRCYVVELVVRRDRGQCAGVRFPVELRRQGHGFAVVHARLVALVPDARVVRVTDECRYRRGQTGHRRGGSIARILRIARDARHEIRRIGDELRSRRLGVGIGEAQIQRGVGADVPEQLPGDREVLVRIGLHVRSDVVVPTVGVPVANDDPAAQLVFDEWAARHARDVDVLAIPVAAPDVTLRLVRGLLGSDIDCATRRVAAI